MSREHNGQFTKFFEAESIIITFNTTFSDEKEIDKAARKIVASAFLQRRYNLERDFRIEHSHLTGKSSSNVMVFRKSDNTFIDVIRAVSRVIAYRHDPRGEFAWHGREFSAIYLDVVQVAMGLPTRKLLEETFKFYGVRYKPKKKVVVTDEMIERLARAREKRS